MEVADAVGLSAYQIEDLTINSALRSVFTTSRNHDKLEIGATQVAKALHRASSRDDPVCPKFVVMAKDLIEDFQVIIKERCKALSIPILFLETRRELASVLPIREVKNAGAVGILSFICESREKAFIINSYKN